MALNESAAPVLRSSDVLLSRSYIGCAQPRYNPVTAVFRRSSRGVWVRGSLDISGVSRRYEARPLSLADSRTRHCPSGLLRELLEFLGREASLPEDGSHRATGDLSMVRHDDRSAAVVPKLHMAPSWEATSNPARRRAAITSRAEYARTV